MSPVMCSLKTAGLLLFFVLVNKPLFAQLTLAEAIAQAKENAPARALIPLAAAENEWQLKNINSNFRPQISVLAQASYQSEVTTLEVPIPNFEIEALSKDQYKIQAEITQSLYDGGLTNQSKTLQQTKTELEVLGVELELEKIRAQIINIYFAILEVDARKVLLQYKKEDLLARQKTVEAAVENGTLLKMESQSLQAALLLLDQQSAELAALRRAQLKGLNVLTTLDLPEDTRLEVPPLLADNFTANPQSYTHRLLALQQTSIDQKSALDLAMDRPKAGLFLQGGYGKPGLNFLKNEFAPYYIVGARVQWNLSGLYTRSADQEIQKLGKEKVSVQKRTYDLQVDRRAEQYRAEIEKLNTLLRSDEEILALREKIKNTASVQLDNGVMTSADYLQKLNEENQARQNKSLHKIQLLKNQYLLEHFTSNYPVQ